MHSFKKEPKKMGKRRKRLQRYLDYKKGKQQVEQIQPKPVPVAKPQPTKVIEEITVEKVEPKVEAPAPTPAPTPAVAPTTTATTPRPRRQRKSTRVQRDAEK